MHCCCGVWIWCRFQEMLTILQGEEHGERTFTPIKLQWDFHAAFHTVLQTQLGAVNEHSQFGFYLKLSSIRVILLDWDWHWLGLWQETMGPLAQIREKAPDHHWMRGQRHDKTTLNNILHLWTFCILTLWLFMSVLRFSSGSFGFTLWLFCTFNHRSVFLCSHFLSLHSFCFFSVVIVLLINSTMAVQRRVGCLNADPPITHILHSID